jgi:hypothetical protein
MESIMPRGDKSSYSSKQKRQAKHIADSEKKEGKSTKSAERIGWATVNKTTGGAKKKKAKPKTKAKSKVKAKAKTKAKTKTKKKAKAKTKKKK